MHAGFKVGRVRSKQVMLIKLLCRLEKIVEDCDALHFVTFCVLLCAHHASKQENHMFIRNLIIIIVVVPNIYLCLYILSR